MQHNRSPHSHIVRRIKRSLFCDAFHTLLRFAISFCMILISKFNTKSKFGWNFLEAFPDML